MIDVHEDRTVRLIRCHWIITKVEENLYVTVRPQGQVGRRYNTILCAAHSQIVTDGYMVENQYGGTLPHAHTNHSLAFTVICKSGKSTRGRPPTNPQSLTSPDSSNNALLFPTHLSVNCRNPFVNPGGSHFLGTAMNTVAWIDRTRARNSGSNLSRPEEKSAR